MKTILQIYQGLFMKGSKGKDLHLTGINLRCSILIGFVLGAFACHQEVSDKPISGVPFGKITYDTFIINRDSTDTWGEECLSDFKRKDLIDNIFKEIYEGKVVPIDYFTGEKISLVQLNKMETDGEFSRKNISKIRFEEQWFWDKEKSEMSKQVQSMTIAYEVYDLSGKSRGQKPIFKLIFRKN